MMRNRRRIEEFDNKEVEKIEKFTEGNYDFQGILITFKDGTILKLTATSSSDVIYDICKKNII